MQQNNGDAVSHQHGHINDLYSQQTKRWTVEKASDWYSRQGWIIGCNYIPATAVNQLEMWQSSSFDAKRIEKELSWAAAIGFNSIRVFLHDLLWKEDPLGLISRIDQFLTIATCHGIKTVFVLFDAVWNPFPKLGIQPAPKIYVHNSGWVQSPGAEILKDIHQYDSLQDYVQGIVSHFKSDLRILAWDLFNEPDNTNDASYFDQYHVHKADLSLMLLEKTFKWIREIDPVQPLTAAPWQNEWSSTALTALDGFMFNHSDIISFHCYESKHQMAARIQALERYQRPLLCTEFMSRHSGSTFQEILPLLKQTRVGGFCWGLVAGKTQTYMPWNSWQQPYKEEPELWFHDIFRENGQPFDPAETAFIRSVTSHTGSAA